MFLGIPLLAVYNIYSAVLRGLGDSKAPFLSVLVCSIANVVLDIIFVVVHLFEQQHEGKHTVYLEIGVGFNTPGIIKYNFWQKVYQNPKARYICLNKDSADAPSEIKDRAICVIGDSAQVIKMLGNNKAYLNNPEMPKAE